MYITLFSGEFELIIILTESGVWKSGQDLKSGYLGQVYLNLGLGFNNSRILRNLKTQFFYKSFKEDCTIKGVRVLFLETKQWFRKVMKCFKAILRVLWLIFDRGYQFGTFWPGRVNSTPVVGVQLF